MQERKEEQIELFNQGFIRDIGYRVEISGTLLKQIKRAIKVEEEWRDSVAEAQEAKKKGKQLTAIVDKMEKRYNELSNLQNIIAETIIDRIKECPF